MPLDLQRIKAICFDIDGTLADTDDLMVEKSAKFLSFLLFTCPQQRRLQIARKLIMTLETPANRVLNFLDRIDCDEWFYRLRIKALPQSKRKKPLWKPIAGVQETLLKLARYYPLAIISVREAHLTQSFIDQMQLASILKCHASAETTHHTKPFPDPILWVAERLKVSPTECLMVGDTTVDIQAGKNAGAQTVGVLSGFGEEKELWAAGADEVIEDVNQLPEIIIHP
jgi:phosphoglycolate phosphatase-like HAD superfamily hydrolase